MRGSRFDDGGLCVNLEVCRIYRNSPISRGEVFETAQPSRSITDLNTKNYAQIGVG